MHPSRRTSNVPLRRACLLGILATLPGLTGCGENALTPTAPSASGPSLATGSTGSGSGYEVIRLGGEESQAIELSGGVVVGATVRDLHQRAAYWKVDDAGSVTGPVELGIPDEGEGWAIGVNDAGNVIALDRGSSLRGFIYDVAGAELVELSAPEGASGVSPRSINAGDVVAGNALYEVDGERAYLPVVWTDPFNTGVEPTSLPLPEGHVSSCSLPVPLNDAGAMIANLMDEDGACWLVRWQLESDGSVSGPQLLESAESSFYRWMNEVEQMAGFTGAGTGSSQAVVREPDGSLVQLDPVSGDDQAVASGITDPASDGSLQVTGTSGTWSDEEKAVVWSVTSDGFPSPPVVLPVEECGAPSRARGVNSDGWIAGEIVSPATGESVAALWRPVSEGGAGDGCLGASHVGDLDGSTTSQGGTWTAFVDALVLDDAGNPVADASVSGSWSDGASGSASCVTAADGRCTVSVDGIRNRTKSVIYTVEDVFHANLVYDATANSDPDGDSDGTSISVIKGDTSPDDGGGDDGDCVPKGSRGNNCK